MSFKFKSLKRKKIDINCGNNIVFTMLGMGGANSYLAYELAQIASLSRKRTDIVMIDTQFVKEDDLKYGKFINKDLGKSRAEVTANRCLAAFDINVETSDKKISSKEDILKIFKGRMGYFPVIICSNIDEKTVRVLNSALENISDVLIIMAKEDIDKGELFVTYKENGIFITENYVKNYVCNDNSSLNKSCSLEMCKNIFLYVDDILCERSISTEKVLFDTRNKTSVSKYIEGEEPVLGAQLNKGVLVDTNNDILCIVIGVGGTGGSVAYEVSHIASTSSKNIKIVFIDGDIIETKNLNRQRFIIQDLNKYKAEVTAKRCRRAYDVDIVDKNEYITSEEDIYSIIKAYKGCTPIILGCSDSLKLRYLVCEAVKNAHKVEGIPENIIYIDAGNGEDYGQVNFTYVKNGEYITPDYFQTSPESLEDVFEAKLVTQMSCDELMNSAPQTKGANMASAITMFSYLEDVINEKPISKYMSYFNNVNRRVESKEISQMR